VTSAELAILASIATGIGAGLLAFSRWAVGLWAQIRREDIAATTARATADRDADARQSDRQVAAIDRIAATVNDHTARDIAAQAEVKQAVVRVEAKVDAALDWQERTPVGDVGDDRPPSEYSERRPRRRLRTVPEGHPALGADSRKNRP